MATEDLTTGNNASLLTWLGAPHWSIGPLITAIVAILIELAEHQHGIPVAAPPAVLVLCIAYSAATSGVRAGLFSAVIAWLYLAHYYAIPGEPLHYTERHLIYILLWAVTAPAMALIIGRLGRRAGLATALERVVAERDRAEREARESEEKFRQLAENIRDVFWITDAEFNRILYVSPAYEEVWGRPRESVYRDPMSWLEAIHPEDRERVIEMLPRIGQARLSDEYRVLRPDGSVRWVSDRSFPVRDAGGRTVRIVGIATDITDRRRSEEELRLLQSITVAVGEAPDLNAALEVVLRRVCAATGWVYGEVWLPCEQDEKLQCGQVFFSREVDLKDFALRSRDYRFARGEGLPGRVWESQRPIWIPDVTRDTNFPRIELAKQANLRASMGIPVLADEEVVAILAFFVHESRPEDERLMQVVSGAAAQLGQVIRRKRAEEALRDNESRLAHAQQIAHLGSWEWEIAAGALHWSDEMFRVFGRVPGEFVPRYENFLEAVHADDRAPLLEALRRTLDEGQPYRIDFRIVRPDGTPRFLHTEAEVLRDAEGRPQRLNGISLDVTEMKEVQERLSYLAHFDVLTGLPNRSLLDDRLQQAMHEANRHERLVGVLFLDLDRFKNINDSLGHAAGDKLLKGVAERLQQVVREGDTVARLSGDEFTIVLADMAHVDDAARVARKVLEIFAQPFRVAGRDLYITASVGITLYPLDDKEPEALLRDADVAMYRAKETGRNNYQFYSADMTAKAAERLALESALRRAIELDELFLVYQPIVDCANGVIVGAEALLRWRHRRRGLILPGDFIPLAEETGIIVPLGEWVLRRACTQMRTWRNAGLSLQRVAVNLSPRQFQQPDFAAKVFGILEETGADPAHLDLEITEGAIMQQPEVSIGTLRRLSERGIALSVDDFGTGYSSLSYLKRFPINHLKIDRSFVRDITTDPNDAALVNAIITMAKSLDIGVIAEGVETQAQLDYLHAHGCRVAQGYLFSRPVSADDFARLLRAGTPLPGDAV